MQSNTNLVTTVLRESIHCLNPFELMYGRALVLVKCSVLSTALDNYALDLSHI